MNDTKKTESPTSLAASLLAFTGSFESPMDAILNSDNSEGNNNDSGIGGLDPDTLAKLLAMAKAAKAAGNIGLAEDLETLVAMNSSSQSKNKAGPDDDDSDKETKVAKGAAAPTDKTKAEIDQEKQEVQVKAVPEKKLVFSQSAVNEKFREDYGKVAYKAYLETGHIATAMQVADQWAADPASKNTAVGYSASRDQPTLNVPGVATGVQLVAVADNPDMSKLVNFTDFPTLAFSSPGVEALGQQVADSIGKRQGTGFTMAPPRPGENA